MSSRALGRVEARLGPPKTPRLAGEPVNTTRVEEFKARIAKLIPLGAPLVPDRPETELCPAWCCFLHRQHTAPFCQVTELPLKKLSVGLVVRADSCPGEGRR